jgi:hypothetical protein
MMKAMLSSPEPIADVIKLYHSRVNSCIAPEYGSKNPSTKLKKNPITNTVIMKKLFLLGDLIKNQLDCTNTNAENPSLNLLIIRIILTVDTTEITNAVTSAMTDSQNSKPQVP